MPLQLILHKPRILARVGGQVMISSSVAKSACMVRRLKAAWQVTIYSQLTIGVSIVNLHIDIGKALCLCCAVAGCATGPHCVDIPGFTQVAATARTSGTWIWGDLNGCGGCAVRLCVGESGDGWLVAWDCKILCRLIPPHSGVSLL